MNSTAIIVNVGGRPVVDEGALASALSDRKLNRISLDVFQAQSLASNHPLLELDNAVLIPHAAGMTEESMRRIGTEMTQEVLRLLVASFGKSGRMGTQFGVSGIVTEAVVNAHSTKV